MKIYFVWNPLNIWLRFILTIEVTADNICAWIIGFTWVLTSWFAIEMALVIPFSLKKSLPAQVVQHAKLAVKLLKVCVKDFFN